MVNSGLKEAAIGVVGDGIKQAVESEAETASVNALANNPAELLNTVSSGSETEERFTPMMQMVTRLPRQHLKRPKHTLMMV